MPIKMKATSIQAGDVIRVPIGDMYVTEVAQEAGLLYKDTMIQTIGGPILRCDPSAELLLVSRDGVDA